MRGPGGEPTVADLDRTGPELRNDLEAEISVVPATGFPIGIDGDRCRGSVGELRDRGIDDPRSLTVDEVGQPELDRRGRDLRDYVTNGRELLEERLRLEPVVAPIASRGHEREHREMLLTLSAERLGAEDALHRTEPRRGLRSRVRTEPGLAAKCGEERERVGGIRGDLSIPNRRYHLVLVHGCDARVSAERYHRRELDELERERDRVDQQRG